MAGMIFMTSMTSDGFPGNHGNHAPRHQQEPALTVAGRRLVPVSPAPAPGQIEHTGKIRPARGAVDNEARQRPCTVRGDHSRIGNVPIRGWQKTHLRGPPVRIACCRPTIEAVERSSRVPCGQRLKPSRRGNQQPCRASCICMAGCIADSTMLAPAVAAGHQPGNGQPRPHKVDSRLHHSPCP